MINDTTKDPRLWKCICIRLICFCEYLLGVMGSRRWVWWLPVCLSRGDGWVLGLKEGLSLGTQGSVGAEREALVVVVVGEVGRVRSYLTSCCHWKGCASKPLIMLTPIYKCSSSRNSLVRLLLQKWMKCFQSVSISSRFSKQGSLLSLAWVRVSHLG